MVSNTYPTSEKGFNNPMLFGIAAIVLFILIMSFGIVLFISKEEAWHVPLVFSPFLLLAGFVLGKIFPNTHQVIVKDNELVVKKKKRTISIPYNNIKRIRASTSMIDSFFHLHEYYRIDLREPCTFGKTIYFQIRVRSVISSSKQERLNELIKQKMIYSS